MDVLIKISDLTKTYQTGTVCFEALCNVTLDLHAGQFVAVMGASGSGKSTLLHLVGGLDRPSAGTIRLDGHVISEMNETELARFRRTHIGFVFQFFNLIDNLTVRDNVELPALLMAGRNEKAIRTRSGTLLARLGIDSQSHKYPWELSGGEQQRVALARALINEPAVLLADEPTGNLDSASGQGVLDILEECHKGGQTILMVTHDPLVAAKAQTILLLHDGHLVGSMPGDDPLAIAHRLAELS